MTGAASTPLPHGARLAAVVFATLTSLLLPLSACSAAAQRSAPGAAAEPTPAVSHGTSADAGAADEPLPDLREVANTLAEALEEVGPRRRGFTLTIELGSVILSPIVDLAPGSVTIDYAARLAYEGPDWAVVASIEHALWRAPELGGQAWQHAINVGVGVERYHRSGLLRTMLLVGPSFLARSNDLDDKGEVGLFVDLRPLGFNWRFGDRWALVVDLFHITLVAPVLSGVPLVDFQFRSTIGIETGF